MKVRKGFTLIELLVVVGIIGLLATLGIVAFGSARAKARDAKRIADLQNVAKALEIYKLQFGRYPSSDGQGPGGMETPGDGDFIHDLVTNGFLPRDVSDPSSSLPDNYLYYRYSAAAGWPMWGCTSDFYILAIQTFEAAPNPHPDNPRFKCPTRDWTSEGSSWVQGGFE